MSILNSHFKYYTMIIGCGRLGASLADSLYEQGGNVCVMDKDKDAFRKLNSSFGGLTVCNDARNIDALKDAEIEKAGVVIIVTNNDNTNIMIAQIAKEVYHIPQVVCRLYDSDWECVYQEFGIDTICPAILSVNEIESILDKKGAFRK